MTSESSQGAVVVGVDGTAASAAAVRWAAAEAARRGAWLRAVHVVDRSPALDGPLEPDPRTEVALRRRTIPARVADQVQSEDLDVQVSVHVVAGHVAERLLEAARTAALLVVGRPDGEAHEWLTAALAERSGCPVVTIGEDGDVQFTPPADPHATRTREGAEHARA